MAGQTRYDAEKNNIIRMKVTPYTTQEIFSVWTPPPKDLVSFFLEEDAVSDEFAIEDKNTGEG